VGKAYVLRDVVTCMRVRDTAVFQMADCLRYLRGRNRCEMSLACRDRARKGKTDSCSLFSLAAAS
jgi:hypothetical protein